jgi:uroporphyrinogen decarboxylase
LKYSKAIGEVFGDRADRGPLFSFWTHFPQDDLDAGRLAEATVKLQHDFDCDIVKTSPNGMYAVEDLGVEIDFSEVPLGGVARIVSTPYERVEDWDKLPEGDFGKGALVRELRSLRLVREALPDVPIVFTLFSPMTIAAKLSRGRIHGQIAEGSGGRPIHAALARLARTMAAYARAALDAGADGIFLAHQDTGRHLLSYDAFSEYVAPYDIEVLAGAAAGRFNVLHIHGDRIRFRELQDYPVQAINWHSWETLPGLSAGALSSRKCVLGGIDRRSVTGNDIPAIRRQIAAAVTAMADVGDLILAPSCTIRAGFDPATIEAMRDFIRNPAALQQECGAAIQPVAERVGYTEARCDRTEPRDPIQKARR